MSGPPCNARNKRVATYFATSHINLIVIGTAIARLTGTNMLATTTYCTTINSNNVIERITFISVSAKNCPSNRTAIYLHSIIACLGTFAFAAINTSTNYCTITRNFDTIINVIGLSD